MDQTKSVGLVCPPSRPYSIDLLSVKTEDGVAIDGALFVPQQVEPVDTALVFIHGKTSNFYSGTGRFLPPMFVEHGITSFSINMRFHDLGYTRTDLPSPNLSEYFFRMAGGAWERIEDGHKDIKAAVELLRTMGYRRIALCGHSSGGFYAVDYVARFHDVAGLVLLSPLTTNKTPLKLWFPDPSDLEAVQRQAEAMVAEGRGDDLIPLRTWYHAISASSFLDRIGEREGWFDEALAVARTPTLWLYGSAEDRAELWRKYYESMNIGEKQLSIIEHADHVYKGYERPVYEAIKGFLNRFVVRIA
jgi:pimeloyl-ACP methyl ester carboxylesterase